MNKNQNVYSEETYTTNKNDIFLEQKPVEVAYLSYTNPQVGYFFGIIILQYLTVLEESQQQVQATRYNSVQVPLNLLNNQYDPQ